MRKMIETCPTCGQPDNCGDCTHEPVSSLKTIDYGHPMHMRMFTDEGNMIVHEATSRIIYDGHRGLFSRANLQTQIRARMNEIEKTHGEVYDTEVRGAIAARINKELCEPMRWIKIDYFFDDEV